MPQHSNDVKKKVVQNHKGFIHGDRVWDVTREKNKGTRTTAQEDRWHPSRICHPVTLHHRPGPKHFHTLSSQTSNICRNNSTVLHDDTR